MKKEDIPFLNQLVKALAEAEIILEESYKKGDNQNFDKAKKFMLKIHEKINEVVK